ncbi:MAG: hypothetical protein E7652_08965 [Ruminococcaceae bacterium]|nr:hypothetical protein [Oscillospiraceae bacterium]
MKKGRIFWGVVLVVIALLLILNAFEVTLGIPEDIPVWRITAGILLVALAVHSAIKRRIFPTVFPLMFTVMLFEKEIALLCNIESGNIASFWTFLLIAFLLSLGLTLLIPKKIKLKAPMGKQTRYIDCHGTINEMISNNMSACEVFFSNTESYNGNGHIFIDNNMGSLILNVPKDWYVTNDITNAMGSIKIPENDTGSFKRLDLSGENNMGSIIIKYVKVR